MRSAAGFLWVCALWASALALPSVEAIADPARATAQSTPPNIILVISDDHAWTDFGFMGSPIAHTPELDRLAREGMVFTHAFNSASVCRPSLQTLLTGLDPIQWEAHLFRTSRKNPGSVEQLHEIVHFDTLPEALARRGYRSFQGGKLFNGTYREAGFEAGEVDENASFDSRYFGGGSAFGRPSIDSMWRFVDADRSRPFFVWFAPSLPHAPYDPAEDDLAPYRDLDIDSLSRLYLGNVTRFDALLGRLRRGLEDRRLASNTLIVFLSDNGIDSGLQAARPMEQFAGRAGGKLSPYELGFRTPLVFHWPGHIAGGRSDSRLLTSADVPATLLELAGAPPLPNRLGQSLAPLLTTGSSLPPRKFVVGGAQLLRADEPEEGPDDGTDAENAPRLAWYLRNERWRYIWWPEQEREALFDIADDPFERNDVAARHPKLLPRFRRQIEAWIDAGCKPWGPTPERIHWRDEGGPAKQRKLWWERALERKERRAKHPGVAPPETLDES